MSTNKLKAWIHASRLRTLPLAAAGIILGSFIAFSKNYFQWNIFIITLVTTLLLQILSNLANDYGDFTHGTDNENRVGPKRAVQSGIIKPKEMKFAMYLTGLLAFAFGIFLLLFSLGDIINLTFLLFLLVGFLAIAAAIKYTVGKSNFGYKGFGDIMVFLFFGIAAVFGSYYLHTKTINYAVLLPASSIGLLSAGVLNINNMRDIINDEQSGKITIAVKLGQQKSKIYHALIIALAIDCTLIYLFIIKNWLAAIIIIPAITLLLIHIFRVLNNTTPKNLDPELKKLSLTTLLFSILLGIGIML